MGYTHGEILAQYESMRRSDNYLLERYAELSPFLRGDVSRWVFLGCGSSYSLAKSMADTVQMHTGLSAAALAGGDVLLHAGAYVRMLRGATIVAVSRSGSTSEILLAVRKLRELGCGFTLLSLCCVENAPLRELADFSLELPWAFDNSVCQTRTVSCLYYAFARLLAERLNDNALKADLSAVLTRGDTYLQKAEEIAKEIAAAPWTHAVVSADAEIAGLAEEGALAFKEICQLPSNFYHVLDARHGPMVLFGSDTLLISCRGTDDAYELDFYREMADKGATVVVISDEPMTGIRTVPFGVPLCRIARGFPLIAFCQLLSFHKSAHSGTDPDAPTGLDPWIAL